MKENKEERNCEICKLYRRDECNGIGNPNTCKDYEKVYIGSGQKWVITSIAHPCWSGWY